jgi:hypothetical protein
MNKAVGQKWSAAFFVINVGQEKLGTSDGHS